MSLPTTNSNGQSSIRSFFHPKPPSYASPPTATPPAQPAVPPPSLPPPPQAPGAAPVAVLPLPATSPDPVNASTLRSPPLHPQATISPILPEYIPALRRITSLLLPVNYPDSFYARLSDPLSSGAFSRVILWDDFPNADPNSPVAAKKVIGGLVCRPEPSPFNPASASAPQQSIFSAKSHTVPGAQPNALYIQSLVLLSPYRHLGLAAALLDEVVNLAVCSAFSCETVYAHVWTNNEEGLRWYLARGFIKTDEVQGYYFKLLPDSAWIVRREIRGRGRATAALGLGALGGTKAGTAVTTTTTSIIPPSATAAAANLTQTPAPPVLAITSPSILPPPASRSTGPSPNRSPGLGGMSYQNTRPDTEWNDLPAEMHTAASSRSSSRSSSTARKKRDRSYPAAAFGK
ncbi:hypothetical protein GGS23DRAFT_579568 [Durotheca rogersii]|uniref:uncharacterized protein n=1 Tax=Durotheca rogersii TaxID=419775 RepID=UPI0022211BE5|nr:uncharacterized protein GGS23DRAFT_579568 [Durotheca rogersii]KAI5860623.1 hypothetical protein GGS23DRAFT_579568 [Durotheca rogersii]